MEPSVGRIVHYRAQVGDNQQCWAAVVTAPSTPGPTTPPAATLTLLPPGAPPQPLTDPVAYDDQGRAYSWHWVADHDTEGS